MGTDVFQTANQFNITVHIKEISHRQKMRRRKLLQNRCQQPSAFVSRRDFTWYNAFICQITKTQCTVTYIFCIQIKTASYTSPTLLIIKTTRCTNFSNLFLEQNSTSDVWLTVHRKSVWIRKTN